MYNSLRENYLSMSKLPVLPEIFCYKYIFKSAYWKRIILLLLSESNAPDVGKLSPKK